MEPRILSLLTDYLTNDELVRGVLHFEPFRSHTRVEAMKILTSECSTDIQKEEIFKFNATELFKKHYNQLAYSPITPNVALFERTKQSILKDPNTFSELEGRVFENDHEQCYAVMHIAGYILKEIDLAQIQLSIPPTTQEKTPGQMFLDYEIVILQFLSMVRSDQNPISTRLLGDADSILKLLIEQYNAGFEHMESREIRKTCMQSAKILIECFWMIASKFISLDDNRAHGRIIKTFELLTCPVILHSMTQFWIQFPTPENPKFYHHTLMRWIIPKHMEIDKKLLDELVEKQNLALSGVIPKVFTLYHCLENRHPNLIEMMLGTAENDNFPSQEVTETQLKEMQQREHENFPIEHFETMWDSIISNSVHEKSTLRKILIRAIISDFENQVFISLKLMKKLGEQFVVQFSNQKFFEGMMEVIRKKALLDAEAARIQKDGYKLIANLQLHHFSHFVNLSPVEAEHCFELILEILSDVPEFENTRTPYEVLSLCFQNSCLHRNLELRNLMSERIVEVLESTNNLHALQHFLLLVSKVLRSHSSEDLMKKSIRPHKNDPLIKGISRIMLHYEKMMKKPKTTLEECCRIHLTCLFILTFCDMKYVSSPLKVWFETINRILILNSKLLGQDEDLADVYSALITKHILLTSGHFPIPQGQLLETIRDATPLFFANWSWDSKKILVDQFSKISNVSQFLESNNSYIKLLNTNNFPMSHYALQRLNTILEGGFLVPFFSHKVLTENNEEVQNQLITQIRDSLELSWTGSVQHEDMEYIAHVAVSQKLSINVYFQFKLRNETDGSETVTFSIGKTVVKLKCSADSEALRCLYSLSTGEKHLYFQTPPFKVHTVMLQISNTGEEVSIINSGKLQILTSTAKTPTVDEVKISVNSLHHTIPVVFQGDCQSLMDVHEMGISSSNIENARRFTLITKGRKLNVGQIFPPVIPIRHNQVFNMKDDFSGFENTVKQLRAAGGFGFIFHSFTKMLMSKQHDHLDHLTVHWELLLAYLNSPYVENERFTRLESLRITSLLLRYSKDKVPEEVMLKIFDMCMMTERENKEAVLMIELLSEPTYWERDLTMFYRLLVRFKSTKPGPTLEKVLPLILQIVARIIKQDNGSDEAHDIVTITIEIFKEWCRDPHPVRTTQMVNFMMDLFDFESISPHHKKFKWIDDDVLEREVSRQPTLMLNGEESQYRGTPRSMDLLQFDLPYENIESDELFRFPTPTDDSPTEKEYKLMTRNRDYLMKGLLSILLQAYVLCPDTQYAYFDSITVEKICYLIEVNNNGKVLGYLVEMYEAIINHNIYSDKITRIFELDLLRILARQLQNKPTNLDTVNALFSILLREQVDVSAGLDTAHLEAFTPNAISCQSVYPLLTVMEDTVDEVDISTFTVVCTSLNKVYIYNNQLTQALTVAGLDENMTAILFKMAKIGDFRIRNEKLKSLLDPWFAFAISIIRVGVNGRKTVFDGTARFISNLLLLYTQENAKLLDNPENSPQRLLRDNIYWTLCVLLLQLFKFLLDIALADSNKHRSASNSSLHMMGYAEDNEELEIAPPKPTKFWDEIAQKVKESVLGPQNNIMKSPYRKHKDTPLSAEETKNRIKEVLILCQYFFKITTRVESDEEENLYKIFFDEISRWTLDEAWPNCIWTAGDMMFVTNVYANCVTFVMTDIHQYITPHKKVFNRQKSLRIELLLQKIVRNYPKISTVFGNVMDIDQMMRLTMENITQREDHNSALFKYAVMFLNSPSRDRGRGTFDYPQPRTPDLIQKIAVESEIALRFWLDQRNEVLSKIDIRSRTPEYHCDVTEINNSLEKMEKSLAAPRNMKRVNEICEMMIKLEENEGVFSRLSLVKNHHKARKITTILGPRGERMITDLTNYKTKEMFENPEGAQKISQFREIFEALSFSRIRKPDVFARFTCLHGLLHANGIQSNPIFQIHRGGITALPCGSHLVEKTYRYEDMVLIFRRPMRPWDALEVSFEILMKNHETILIFSQQKLAKLLSQYAGKIIASENHLLTVTKQWEEGKTSNYEYLMMLNLFAGRTFHDSSSYPIFPRIIAKFGEHEIDLLDKAVYRKLDKPVAAQDAGTVEKHRQHYNELKENEEVSHLTPYHYGSMCSNRGVVSFYNIRLLPFGEEAIELQDGRFDFPDRLFHNIESGIGMGKIESSNDYKELVPELFTTVEVLRNENGNKFGDKQNGQAVNDVEVPNWCMVNGHPVHELFIQVHRQALESEHVQSTLHGWIDLVFGYKSRGKAALDATNVYHPAVYPGSAPPSGFDSLLTNAYEANQKTLGTAPNQLFNQPHPKREVIQNRHGSVRNMHGLAFGKELTVGAYEVSEFSMERNPTERVWRRMKNLKSRIFNKSDKMGEPIQLFKQVKDRKEKDPSDLTVKVKECTLTLSDGTSEATKEHTKKVIDVSVEEQYVACLIHQGPIELYKLVYKPIGKSKIAVVRNEAKILAIEYYGTIPIQNGHYLSVDLCASFSTVFTIHKVEGNSIISVWDLHSQHIRAQCEIDGVLESCGVLKGIGELVVVEKWNGEQVRYEKQWRTKKKMTKKKKYTGKVECILTQQTMAKISINAKPYLSKYIANNQFVHSGVVSMAPEPGMGIQTLAMIRNDSGIVLFETLSLTQMRVFEVDNGPGFCLRELRYQEDNTLVAMYKENRALRKKNKELYKNLGCAPPTRTWWFKPK